MMAPVNSLGIRASITASVMLACCNSFGGDLTVMEAVWTTSVVNREYGTKVEPNSPAQSLYFWTKLKGGKAALEELKKEGKLPIKHHWKFSNIFKTGSGIVDPDQEGKVLPAGGIQDERGGISSLVSQGGNFTWRTWTHKESVWGGAWTVTVKYATGEPIICNGKPCSWTIKLGD